VGNGQRVNVTKSAATMVGVARSSVATGSGELASISDVQGGHGQRDEAGGGQPLVVAMSIEQLGNARRGYGASGGGAMAGSGDRPDWRRHLGFRRSMISCDRQLTACIRRLNPVPRLVRTGKSVHLDLRRPATRAALQRS